MRYKLLALSLILIGGCSTPYREQSWLLEGGVKATQISSDTYLISSSGNDATDQSKIQKYAMRKAAEVTLSGGNDWFAVASNQSGTKNAGGAFLPGAAGGLGLFAAFSNPHAELTVKVGKNPRPDGAFDAREVSAFTSK